MCVSSRGGPCEFHSLESGLGRHSFICAARPSGPGECLTNPTGWACVPASPRSCFGRVEWMCTTIAVMRAAHGVGVQQVGEDWDGGDGDGSSDALPTSASGGQSSVRSDGHRRAGQALVLLQLLATAATGNKLQVGTTIYFRRLTYRTVGSGDVQRVWCGRSPVQ